jgi:uncharacterized protein YdhG (YjbR/CyaY superfamily)
MNDIDKYLNRLSEDRKRELQKIREIVKHAIPSSTELISYGMPGFKYKNHYLIGYGAFKKHLSVFPTSQPIEQLVDELQGFRKSKGTIQFSETNRIPDHIIVQMVMIRKKQIDGK